MTRVFLSYAMPDKAFASKLSRALAERGAETFDPHEDLMTGEEISSSLIGHLKRTDIFVFVVPRFEGQGKNALIELGAAKALGKRIVAVLPDMMRSANTDVSILGSMYSLEAAGKDVNILADQVLSDLAAA